MANRKSQQARNLAQGVIGFVREHPLIALFAVFSVLVVYSAIREGLPNTAASGGLDGTCEATVLKSPHPFLPLMPMVEF